MILLSHHSSPDNVEKDSKINQQTNIEQNVKNLARFCNGKFAFTFGSRRFERKCQNSILYNQFINQTKYHCGLVERYTVHYRLEKASTNADVFRNLNNLNLPKELLAMQMLQTLGGGLPAGHGWVEGRWFSQEKARSVINRIVSSNFEHFCSITYCVILEFLHRWSFLFEFPFFTTLLCKRTLTFIYLFINWFMIVLEENKEVTTSGAQLARQISFLSFSQDKWKSVIDATTTTDGTLESVTARTYKAKYLVSD